MKLYVLFGLENVDSIPDPLTCWSGYQREDNEEGFQEDMQKERDKWHNDYEKIELVEISVCSERIVKKMFRVISVKGEIVGDR